MVQLEKKSNLQSTLMTEVESRNRPVIKLSSHKNTKREAVLTSVCTCEGDDS